MSEGEVPCLPLTFFPRPLITKSQNAQPVQMLDVDVDPRSVPRMLDLDLGFDVLKVAWGASVPS